MKSIFFIAAFLAAAANGHKLNDPLTAPEEARVIENAVLSRTVGGLDSAIVHPNDGDHSAAISSMRGIWHSNEDAILKMGKLKNLDPVLGKAVERINHPYFPYPKK